MLYTITLIIYGTTLTTKAVCLSGYNYRAVRENVRLRTVLMASDCTRPFSWAWCTDCDPDCVNRSLQNGGVSDPCPLHVIKIVDSLSHVSHKELQIMAHVIVTSDEAKFKVAVTVGRRRDLVRSTFSSGTSSRGRVRFDLEA